MDHVNDIAFGDERIMVVVGRRRLVVSGLTRQHVEDLKASYRDGTLARSSFLKNIVAATPTAAYGTANDEACRRWILLHSIGLQKPVMLLGKLVDWRWMLAAAIAISSIAAFRLQDAIQGMSAVMHLVVHPAMSTYPIVLATLCALALVHELAHVAACYRFSGIVGSIGLFVTKRSGGLYADVSALNQLRPTSVAVVYVAGPAVQIMASTLLVVTLVPALEIAGLASLMLCLINLAPIPSTDGSNALAALRRKSSSGKPDRRAG